MPDDNHSCIQLRDEWRTDCNLIDLDHEVLVVVINRVIDAMRGESGPPLQHAANLLKHYIREHFSRGEKLMYQYGYKDIEEHIKSHDEFLSSIGKLLHPKTLTNGGTAEEVECAIEFLHNWVIAHISVTDRDFAIKCLVNEMRPP